MSGSARARAVGDGETRRVAATAAAHTSVGPRLPVTIPGGAGNRAIGLVLQRRESRADALAWLRTFLATGPAGGAAAMSQAAAKLGGWSADRQQHLIRQVRGRVDAFEIAVGAAGLLNNADAGRVLGILEGAQTNDALGTRLVTLFRASVEPSLGLVIAANLPQIRVRAVLQPRADAGAAIGSLEARNPAAGVAGGLRPTRTFLATLRREIAAPLAEGLVAPTGAAEARIEAMLTPPAVAHARAAAAAAGLPPPAFVPAGYYEGLMRAVHAAMLGHWPQANAVASRRSMDVAPGGHVEGIATEAKRRVDAIFGAYGSAAAPALTFNAGSLNDQTATAGDPGDMTRYFVEDEGGDAVTQAKETHHAFEDAAAAGVIEQRVIDHYSGRTAPAAANEQAALAGLGMDTAERQRRLRIIDRMWPGLASGGRVFITAREGANQRETRGIYWGLFKTMIHEYLHTTEHATFKTWYGGLADAHHRVTFQEGMTDLFTLQTWRSIFPNEVAANAAFRTRIQGPSDRDLDMRAVGGDPSHYPELAEAQQLEAELGTANLRAARFQGRTDLLGGSRLPR